MYAPKTFKASILIVAFVNVVAAAEADRFVKIAANKAIDVKQDHYSVSLIKGWVSARDGSFKALLSSKSKMIVSIDSEVTHFDGEKLTVTSLYENPDVKKNTDAPWGRNELLLDNVPADAHTRITVRIAIHRDDRISELFKAAEEAKPTVAGKALDIYAAPWVGYSKVVSGIISKLFGTTKKDYPFYWSGNIKLGDVSSNGKLQTHYILLVTPNKTSDTSTHLDASQLAYDESSQQLKYYNSNLTDHSFAVLRVDKSDGFNIPQLLLESTAPWAVLATKQLLTAPTIDTENLDQLKTLAKGFFNQLQDQSDLLKREHRFSAFDRASALEFFAKTVQTQIETKCKSLKLDTCPTSELINFRKTITDLYGLPKTENNLLAAKVAKLHSEIFEEKFIRNLKQREERLLAPP